MSPWPPCYFTVLARRRHRSSAAQLAAAAVRTFLTPGRPTSLTIEVWAAVDARAPLAPLFRRFPDAVAAIQEAAGFRLAQRREAVADRAARRSTSRRLAGEEGATNRACPP